MTKPFEVQDLYLLRKIGSIDCARDPALVAAAVSTVDRDNNSDRTHLWLFGTDGACGKQISFGTGTDDTPRWSPDADRLAFRSTRGGGSSQLFLMPRCGGEARQVGSFAQGVMNLRWAPDGQAIFVTAARIVDPDLHGQRGPLPEVRYASAPEVAWRLPYKADGVGYLLGREIHLYCVDVASGAQTLLTDGAFDVMAFDVSADGRSLAYTRTRDARFAHRTDLWVCDTDGGRARRLTDEHAAVSSPKWAPDGRTIAFSGAIVEGDARSGLWLVDVENGQSRALGGDDLEVADAESLHWDEGGRSVVVIAMRRGRHQIVRVDVASGAVTVVVGEDRQIGAFGCAAGHFVFTVDHPAQAPELWAVPRTGGTERSISALNAWWNDRQPIAAELRQFDVPDGRGGRESIDGWVLRKRGSRGPQPLLDEVHGGPATIAPLAFDTHVAKFALCASGWTVLMLNSVGSASYGRDFCMRLCGHWGELDLPQHVAAIEQLQREGVASDQVAISGSSYGGYLSAWATGNTDTFRAAVVVAPVGNIETHYGTSDGGFQTDPFYMGPSAEFDRKTAVRLSPMSRIEHSRTPTLFLHGKDDERCPKCQSEELFVSLARRGGTDTELVLYPGETHSFMRAGAPMVREDSARRFVDWIVRHSAEPLRDAPTDARKEVEEEEPVSASAGASTNGR